MGEALISEMDVNVRLWWWWWWYLMGPARVRTKRGAIAVVLLKIEANNTNG